MRATGKGRVLSALAALVLLLCGGCRGEREEMAAYILYYPTSQEGAGGQALAVEERSLPNGSGPEELLRALLAGPEGEGLSSPFPRETALRSCRVESDGTAEVDLTEPYGGLSGVEQTLADSIITLTLCQLEEIRQVHITVEGLPRPYRDRILAPEDLLLDNGAVRQGSWELRLWFSAGEGLDWEERTLTPAPGDDRAIAALQALSVGPDDQTLQRVCPQGAAFTLRQWEHRYALDLTEAWFGPEGDELWLQAVVATLAEVDPRAQVTITAEGKPLGEVTGLDLSQPVEAARWLPKEVIEDNKA